MLEQKLQLAHEGKIAPIELYCWPSKLHPYFQKIQSRYSLQLYNQVGGNLGECMAHAMQHAINQDSKAVLIGTDSPSLDRDYIINAFKALQSGVGGVMGPAEDGGYVLIGLSRFNNRIFQDIEWGSDSVYRQTISKFKQLNINYTELDTLWDVDCPDDLLRLGDYYN